MILMLKTKARTRSLAEYEPLIMVIESNLNHMNFRRKHLINRLQLPAYVVMTSLTLVVVDGNAAKDLIEDNYETQEFDLTRKANQDLDVPIYYGGLDIVKPHVVSSTLGKYIIRLAIVGYSLASYLS